MPCWRPAAGVRVADRRRSGAETRQDQAVVVHRLTRGEPRNAESINSPFGTGRVGGASHTVVRFLCGARSTPLALICPSSELFYLRMK